jgi:hypothetical protein
LIFFGIAELTDSAIIHVIWHPDNCVRTKVPDLGSGGIKGVGHALIDMTLCTIDRTAPITFTNIEPATVAASGMLLNNIIWLSETKNTVVRPQKGVECEFHNLTHTLGRPSKPQKFKLRQKSSKLPLF